MKIYYAPNTRAVRILWLCKELSLPYELVTFQLGDKKMRAKSHLRAARFVCAVRSRGHATLTPSRAALRTPQICMFY